MENTKTEAWPLYEPGEIILYQNGDIFKLGQIKRLAPNPNTYFVWYHEGDTAACTPACHMHKIANLYAFKVERETVE